jgi:hypothetical protein
VGIDKGKTGEKGGNGSTGIQPWMLHWNQCVDRRTSLQTLLCQSPSTRRAACFRFSVFSRPCHHVRFPFSDKDQAFQFTFTKPGAPGWPTLGETLTSQKRKRQHSISIQSRRRCIEAVENSTSPGLLLAHPKRLLDKRTITERRRIQRKALWKRYRPSRGVLSDDLRR